MYKVATKIFILSFLLILGVLQEQAFGQASTQRIKGRILDQETNEPVANAEVELMNYVPLKVATTNEAGEYELRGVPIGVHRLLVIHQQYQTLMVPDVEITVEQPTLLNIKMKAELFAAYVAPLTAKAAQKRNFTVRSFSANNSLVSAVNLYDDENSLRIPGGFSDVLQLLGNNPNIHPTGAFQNQLSAVGSNPMFATYRVDGIPVNNLNHLPNIQTSSGSFSLLNTQYVSDFDLIVGGISAEYGNSTTALADVRLKSGNPQRTEINFELSPVFLETSIELPIHREKGQSFIGSYRHSSFPILDLANINYLLKNGGPSFQDAHFKVDLPRSTAGDYSFFGMWGRSNYVVKGAELFPDARQFYGNQSMQGLLGFKHQIRVSPKLGINTVIGGNFHQYNQTIDSLELNALSLNSQIYQKDHALQAVLRTNFEWRIDRENLFKMGIEGNYYLIDMHLRDRTVSSAAVDFKGHTFSTQFFALLHSIVSNHLSFNVGLNAQYFQLSRSLGISPRIGMRWDKGNHSIGVNAGIMQQELPLFVYLQQKTLADGSISYPNQLLDFIRNNYVTFNYRIRLGENWILKMDGYFHYWDNLPMATDTTIHYVLNNVNPYQTQLSVPALSTNNWGYHYGGSLTLEKFFNQGYYGSLSASAMQSEYQRIDGKVYNSAFNAGYYGVFLFGKDFRWGNWGNNTLGFYTRFFYSNGLLITPIDLLASQANNQQVVDQNQLWSERLPEQWSWDLRMVVKIKSKRYLHALSIDALNILNTRNPLAYLYNPQSTSIDAWRAMGRSINVTYRFNWSSMQKK